MASSVTTISATPCCVARRLGIASRIFRPDVIHCHDWQASLVPVYLKSTFRHDPVFYGIKTLLTIHNLGYQGRYGPDVVPYIAVPRSEMQPEGVEYFGDINYLKGRHQLRRLHHDGHARGMRRKFRRRSSVSGWTRCCARGVFSSPAF